MVFVLNEKGEYDTYRVKYDFTEEELKTISEQELKQKNVTFTDVTYSKIGIIVCISSVTYQLVSNQSWTTSSPDYHYEWVVQGTKCYNLDSSAEEGGGGSDGSSGSDSSSGSDCGGSVSQSPQTTILTLPVHGGNIKLLDEFKSKISFNLNQDQVKFLLDYSNFDFLNQLNNFLEISEEGDEQQFVQQIIEQSMLNPDMHFNVRASYNSPFKIDLTSLVVNPTDLPMIKSAKEKFNFVYDKLMNTPEFKALFIDLFLDNTKLNVKFEMPPNLYSSTNPNIQVNGNTTPSTNLNTITIKINQQILNLGGTKSATNIEIAKTILHECIHAYLMVKALYPSAGQTIPNTQNMDLQQLINAINTDQHDFMYNHMVPTLETILSQLLNQLTTASKRAILENNYTIHPNYITNPSISTQWDWTKYIYYLSLQGLQQCNSFITDFPSQPVLSDAYSTYQQYSSYGHAELDYSIIP